MVTPESALVADDEGHLRVYLRLILKDLGIEQIWEAKNGREAVDAFRQHRPDIVFLDINMPEVTGLEALTEIIELDAEAVVVMLTGHASRQLIETSQKSGASHYIRKDTPREEIARMLRELFADVYGDD